MCPVKKPGIGFRCENVLVKARGHIQESIEWARRWETEVPHCPGEAKTRGLHLETDPDFHRLQLLLQLATRDCN